MSTRTLALTNALAYATVPVAVFLQTPGGLPVVDLEGKVYFNGQAWGQSLVTGAIGAPWTLTDVFPGDLRDGNGNPLSSPAQLVVVEGTQRTVSPPDFAYASSITVSTWYPVAGGSTAGMWPMFLDLALLDTTPDVAAVLTFTLSTTVVAPDDSVLRGGVPISGTTNVNGIVSNLFWPSSGLNPNTAAYLVQFPDGSGWKFRRPDNPTGFAGTYDAGTAYFAHAGTKLSPADVVLDSGVYYQCIADTTGHAPPNVTYWQLWLGEPVVWNLTAIAFAGVPTIDTTGVRNSPNLAPQVSDPVTIPQLLDDDLRNLAARIAAAVLTTTLPIGSLPYYTTAWGRQTLGPFAVFA